MTENRQEVRQLRAEDVPGVVDILCESFHDYPVMRYTLGPSGEYDRRLRTLIQFFVMARVLRREVLLGVGEPGGLSGVALVSYPDRPASPPELAELRETVWSELGTSSRERYEAFGAAAARFEVEVPHIHLNMVGVRLRAQGEGHGRRLIEHVHRMSGEDPASRGVTLSTEKEANISLYRHLGYELIGHAVVAPELQSWGMFRPDQ